LGAGRGGEQVGVVLRFGYLYLRLPGLTDPMLALRGAIALPPSGGLAADPAWRLALEHVGQGDVVFFSRPSEKDAQGRVAAQVGLAAFSLLDGAEALQMKLFARPRRIGSEELQKMFTPPQPPPDLAARLPAGPAAYLKISGRPEALFRELLAASQADANRARDRARELTGLDLEKDLLPAFAGNFGIALYLDATALLQAVLGEEVGAFDRSGFLVAAELAPDRARMLQQAIDKKVSAKQRVPVGGTTLWKLGGGAAMAAVKDGFLYFAVGGLPQEEPEPAPAAGRKRRGSPRPPRPSQLGPIGQALAPERGARTLGDQLKEAGLSGLDAPTVQAGWFDVRGLLRSLQVAAEGEGGMVGAGARMVVDRMAALRDALFLARPVPDGVDASLSLRFRRERGRGSGGAEERPPR
ncbi:MAG TPA: hypothetical protein VE964_10880, partial [Myxococcales bacterium]|nr:hypothetical protein [Myxococcales bacterium]